ncbi:MAG: ComEC/Rec2 family competence protein, partial [Desulfovibrionaceae bacterium]|nr:ComEC/Rec2 family competence protein [Desulfovibrionaceae bacterium]
MRHPPLQAPLIWQIYLAFWIAGVAAAVWPLPALTCAALLLWLDKRLHHWPRFALVALTTLTALTLALWQLAPPQTPDWLASRQQRICGTLVDIQGLPDQRLRLLLDDVRPEGQKTAPPLPGLVAWTWEAPQEYLDSRPLPGQSVCLGRNVRPIRGFANFGLADWDTHWLARNVHWRVWSHGKHGQPAFSGQGSLSARWREQLRLAFISALGLPALAAATPPPDQSFAILPALLFGDRHYLTQDTVENFAAATLAHSLALSGQHLAVAGLVGLICILGAARAAPGLYLWRPRMTLALLAACPPALAYLWLGNAPASLVRAVCMLLILAFWLTRHKARTTLDVLWAALACICLTTPLSVLDTGLQLSALCVAVIGMSLPWLRRLLPEKKQQSDSPLQCAALRILRWGFSILMVSLLIQIALLPLNLLL